MVPDVRIPSTLSVTGANLGGTMKRLPRMRLRSLDLLRPFGLNTVTIQRTILAVWSLPFRRQYYARLRLVASIWSERG